MNEIATCSPDDTPPWGKAHPMRGANHVMAAMQFVKQFPVGTVLSTRQFDRWAQEANLLPAPSSEAKGSDGWCAHNYRMNTLRYNINNAGSHPRMETPFVVESVGKGMLEVRSPESAIARFKMATQIESLANTKHKQLGHLMQSTKWDSVPAYERIFAESLYDDIASFVENTTRSVSQLTNKFAKLDHNLRLAIERGVLGPDGGEIKGILGPDKE